jgi:hypothetical protein
MNGKEIAEYPKKVEGATKAATEDGVEASFRVLIERTETIVEDLTHRLAQEGVTYGPSNEPRATARVLLWASWVSWLWTAEAEGRGGMDYRAEEVRPRVEWLLQHFIEAGRHIGRNGRRPEEFLRSP